MIFVECIIVGYKDGKPIYWKRGFADSSETKPIGDDAADICDGSQITESNTGALFYYNEKTDSWINPAAE